MWSTEWIQNARFRLNLLFFIRNLALVLSSLVNLKRGTKIATVCYSRDIAIVQGLKVESALQPLNIPKVYSTNSKSIMWSTEWIKNARFRLNLLFCIRNLAVVLSRELKSPPSATAGILNPHCNLKCAITEFVKITLPISNRNKICFEPRVWVPFRVYL